MRRALIAFAAVALALRARGGHAIPITRAAWPADEVGDFGQRAAP